MVRFGRIGAGRFLLFVVTVVYLRCVGLCASDYVLCFIGLFALFWFNCICFVWFCGLRCFGFVLLMLAFVVLLIWFCCVGRFLLAFYLWLVCYVICFARFGWLCGCSRFSYLV